MKICNLDGIVWTSPLDRWSWTFGCEHKVLFIGAVVVLIFLTVLVGIFKGSNDQAD
jgi:hypothetical protein